VMVGIHYLRCACRWKIQGKPPHEVNF